MYLIKTRHFAVAFDTTIGDVPTSGAAALWLAIQIIMMHNYLYSRYIELFYQCI